MVALIDGVTKLFPVTKADPPVATSNHFKVPALAVALKLTLPASHLVPGVVVRIVGIMLIVAVTGVLAEKQFPLAAST